MFAPFPTSSTNLMTSLLQNLIVFLTCHFLVAEARLAEYCQTETFNASCPYGHVVQMTAAEYGRMNLGRCVETDFGFIGCRANVLSTMDQLCSGKPSCSVRIPDAKLDAAKPCNGDLTRYLAAAYKCVPVITAELNRCRRSTNILATSSGGLLSSFETSRTECGTSIHPWSLTVLPYQRINITLIDFGFTKTVTDTSNGPKGGSGGSLPPPMICRTYGFIRDPASHNKQVPICGGNYRQSNTYMSKGNTLEISLSNTGDTYKNEFLLKYTVMGCEEPHYKNMIVQERSASHLTFKCPTSSKVWRLTCHGKKWVGDVGSCSGVKISQQKSNQWNSIIRAMPNGVAIMLIIIIAFIIGACILLLGLVLIRKKRTTQRRQQMIGQQHIYSGMVGGKPPDYTSYDPRHQQPVGTNQSHKYITNPRHQQPNVPPHQRLPNPEENQYAYSYRKQHGVPPGEVIAAGIPRGIPQDDNEERHVEHVYESPVFSRRDFPPTDGPQYFELNPEEMSRTGNVNT